MKGLHGDYIFYIVAINNGHVYFIMDKIMDRKIKTCADEIFDTEFQARMAAIGHIELIQQEKTCLNG